jgi:uncharacterized oxidoreductase
VNTDLGGKGLHDIAPAVDDFIESVFEQLKEEKTEIAFEFSETLAKASPEDLKNIFNRMNANP